MTIRVHLLPYAPSKEEKELFTSGLRGENVHNKRVTKRFENLLSRRGIGEGNFTSNNNNVTSSSIIARMNPFSTDENNASCLVSCEGSKGTLRFSKIDFDDRSIVRKYQLQVEDEGEVKNDAASQTEKAGAGEKVTTKDTKVDNVDKDNAPRAFE